MTRRSGAAKALVEHPRGPARGWHPGSPRRQDEFRSSRNARREVCAATSSCPQWAVALVVVCDTVLRRPTHPEVTCGAYRRLFAGSGAWSTVPARYADLPFMYLLNWLPMTCAGRSRVQGRGRRWRALPCWDPLGGLAWRRGLPVWVAAAGEGRGRAAMRRGLSRPTSCGVLPAGGLAAMWAGAIQARSSTAGSRVAGLCRWSR